MIAALAIAGLAVLLFGAVPITAAALAAAVARYLTKRD